MFRCVCCCYLHLQFLSTRFVWTWCVRQMTLDACRWTRCVRRLFAPMRLCVICSTDCVGRFVLARCVRMCSTCLLDAFDMFASPRHVRARSQRWTYFVCYLCLHFAFAGIVFVTLCLPTVRDMHVVCWCVRHAVSASWCLPLGCLQHVFANLRSQVVCSLRLQNLLAMRSGCCGCK